MATSLFCSLNTILCLSLLSVLSVSLFSLARALSIFSFSYLLFSRYLSTYVCVSIPSRSLRLSFIFFQPYLAISACLSSPYLGPSSMSRPTSLSVHLPFNGYHTSSFLLILFSILSSFCRRRKTRESPKCARVALKKASFWALGRSSVCNMGTWGIRPAAFRLCTLVRSSPMRVD